MNQPAKSQEPSMEEILASIRRIIADDDANKSVQRVPEPPKPVAPPPRVAAPPPVAPPEPSFPEIAEVPAAETAPVEPDVGDQSADILELTESMEAPMPLQSEPDPEPISEPPRSVQFRTIDAGSDVGFDDEPAEPVAPPPQPQFTLDRGDDARSRLLSSETTAAVDSAFNTLAHTVLVQNARTLEDLVREMLRPMLKSWLDDNLPKLVERLVRAEIERVSRGRSS
jgi:uncharacterized protein